MSKYIIVKCHFCGTETTRSKYIKGPYPTCKSPECQSKLHILSANVQNELSFHLFIERWKDGLEKGMKGTTGISGHIRKYLFERAGAACESCGWNKVNLTTGRIPLEVNHKDGDHTNNAEENLELICPNCHSLTSTYRSLNKGRGRPRGNANRLVTKTVLKTDLP